MEAFAIAGTVVGSLLAAFWLQKAALRGLLKFMGAERRARH